MPADEPRADALTPEQAAGDSALSDLLDIVSPWRRAEAIEHLARLLEADRAAATERQAAETAALLARYERLKDAACDVLTVCEIADPHPYCLTHHERLPCSMQALSDTIRELDAATQPAPDTAGPEGGT